MAAFEQLHAEGYVDGRVGAGSFVSHRLPTAVLGARARRATVSAPPRATRAVGARRQARRVGTRPVPRPPLLARRARAGAVPVRRLGAPARAPLAPPQARLPGRRRPGRLPPALPGDRRLSGERARGRLQPRAGDRGLGHAAGARSGRAGADRSGRPGLDRGAGLSADPGGAARRRRAAGAGAGRRRGPERGPGPARRAGGPADRGLALAPVPDSASPCSLHAGSSSSTGRRGRRLRARGRLRQRVSLCRPAARRRSRASIATAG